MASPLTVARNDYHKNKKNSTIYTPTGVAKFLYDVLRVNGSAYPPYRTVFDPAIGSGRLTDPWFAAGHFVVGCDIARDPSCKAHEFIKGKFEECTWPLTLPTPDLVTCNSPFNGAPGKQLYPELFLKRIFGMFGPEIPTVLFAPMGLLKNQRKKSKRWRWLRDSKAKITSIISLPLDIFNGVEFHSEIILFNIAGVQPHYFLPEEALA